jgi:phosphoglucosamine mutase
MNPSRNRLFGTDGVRGTANIEPVTAETALKLGRAAAHVFKTLESHARGLGRHKIVIGKDTRLSGYMLENALSSGILSMGVDVIFIGPLPTPGVAYVTRSLRADAGIVITASHNPYDDNGIKFFRADGYKLEDHVEGHIEELVASGAIEHVRPVAGEIGKALRVDDAIGRYIEYAKASFPKGMNLEGVRVVVDAANGAGYKTTPCVLRELGAEVLVYGHQPDGTNINRDCGAMHPELLCRKVLEHRAQLGIAHDGDADRVQLCDEQGQLVDGDDILALMALDRLAQGSLPEKTVVTTVMSNAGLDAAIRDAGGRVVRTAVGDKYVIDEMLKHGFALGGEQSGHIIFREYATTGDGLVAALQVLSAMRAQNALLSQLRLCWTRFPQKLVNIRVREKLPWDQVPGFPDLLQTAEAEVAARGGRVFVRYSGTEPKARILVEARDQEIVDKWCGQLAQVVQEHLGVRAG